ncbi:MAG: efflux RND transporter permease subunit [Deltaproteobacteria bacterium]|nr:efflux RND transporter permease subunit [Deltaproteobacteria bacterium]
MLRALVGLSIRHRVLVIALACLAVAYGLYVTFRAKLDVFPDFVPPQVVIQTESPGLSPEQVETLVTQPVENAVAGAGSIESIRSQSIAGLSIVTVVFAEGTDVFTARQMVAERLSEVAGELPDGVDSPKLTPLTSSTMDLLKVGLVSDRMTGMELRSFADWVLRPRLQAVPGVASVDCMGGEVRQLQVQLAPERLAPWGLTVADVLGAAEAATGVRGAGFVENDNQRVVLRTEGQALTPAQLGEVVVVRRGERTVRLRDVANVVEAPAPPLGDAMIQGRPGVLVKMLSQYGVNTMEATQAVERALADMRPSLDAAGIRLYPRLHRPATFIETALDHIRSALLLGGVLVVVVLFLFLLNLRTAFISITAIPFSLLLAIVVLDRLGYSLNTITLGGFAISIGVVVDDAIIDVENVWRRLRENAALVEPRPPLDVVYDASLEVRSPIVYATFVVLLVFVPVLTMSGLQGSFFAPLALSYSLATLASLLAAVTLTPALCAVLLPRRAGKAAQPHLMRGLRAGYRRLVAAALPHPWTIGAVGLVLCAGAAALLPLFGGEFLPEFREGHFVMQMSASPGTSIAEMTRLGNRVSAELLRDRRIATVEQQIGRAELSEDPWGPHRSEFHVELRPGLGGDDERDVQRRIRGTLAQVPGITSEVLTFLGDRIGETVSGETSAVVINIFGDDLDVLDAKAREVAAAVSAVPGAADVRVASPAGAPETVVALRPDRLLPFGFRPLDVMNTLRVLFQGVRVAQTYEGNRVTDVVVILDPARRRDPEAVGSLLLADAAGTRRVALRELADIYPESSRFMILHDGARRRQAVTCNVEGRDVDSFVADARRAIDRSVVFPPGVYTVFGGASEARAQARNEILLHSGLAGIGILLLLATVFGRVRNLLLVLVNVPFALVGGVAAVALTSGMMSIGSLVGFVTLFGITMRNSVMMVSHFDHLVTREGMTWGPEAALRGASERIVPVLMTALVTALGLLPIALAAGEAGGELEGPMAVVILGGLATSTLLNLLVLPSLALRFGRFGGKPEPAPRGA